MLSAEISRVFINSGISSPSIDTSRLSRDPYRSESSLTVILLSSLVYTYSELLTTWEEDTMPKTLLIEQETE